MRRRYALLGLILGIGVLDAGLKNYALQHFPPEQLAELQPVLSLALHKNPGIAFDIPIPLGIVIPLTLAVCVAFASLAYRKRLTNPNQALAAVATVIGAAGNACDRLINNFTTDYLILFKTSAINLSDVLILLGILGVLWYDTHTPVEKQGYI